MNDFLLAHFNLWRGLHILAVIAWMAGLLYLPRLFAYHTTAQPGGEYDQGLRTQELKLFKIIMNPAFVVTWVFGATLIYVDGQTRGWDFLTQPWMIAKLAGVLFLSWWHHYLGRARKAFERGENKRSNKFWRAVNELPFLAAIVMVLAVTTEFGSR